jgi:hypothetical protein
LISQQPVTVLGATQPLLEAISFDGFAPIPAIRGTARKVGP